MWEDEANAELRRLRGNPFILAPGDVVHVPRGGKTTMRIRFNSEAVVSLKKRAKQQPLNLKLVDPGGEALAETEYTLRFPGGEASGATDAEGSLSVGIPVGVTEATLEAGGFTWNLDVGRLDPLRETEDQGWSGAQGRLLNLGYKVPLSGAPDGPTRAKLKEFQRDNGLEATGDLDDPTRDKLAELHGC